MLLTRSYSEITSCEQDPTLVIARVAHDIENDEELKEILDSISRVPKGKSKPTQLTPSQVVFLDRYSENIYDMYYAIRGVLEERGFSHKVDYNGYMEMILRNLSIVELPCESDDETGDIEDGP